MCRPPVTNMPKNIDLLPKDGFVHREGFVKKRTGILRLWKPRYFILLDDVLCYFLKEEHKETLAPVGRIFLSDILSLDRTEKKSNVFTIVIKLSEKCHFISCPTYEEREGWFQKISDAIEQHKNVEQHDAVRTKSTRLGKDFKRVTIKKDPKHGIGCTIKNVGGAIFVSRIIPDGPVATTGVLRPGDQIVDINGNQVSSCSIEKIKEIITSSPISIVCTVKPVSHYATHDSPQTVRTAYTEVDPLALRASLVDETQVSYTEVNIDKSVEDLSYLGTEKPPNSINKSISQDSFNRSTESIDSETPKKMTSYVELEFGKR